MTKRQLLDRLERIKLKITGWAVSEQEGKSAEHKLNIQHVIKSDVRFINQLYRRTRPITAQDMRRCNAIHRRYSAISDVEFHTSWQMDRNQKISSSLQKLTWLGDIVIKLVRMDRHHLGPGWIDGLANRYMSMIELLRGKLQQGRLITKSDMQVCNHIFKELRHQYKFNTDCRGDIVDCRPYTDYISSQAKWSSIPIWY